MSKERIYELMVIFDSQGDEAEIHREFDVVQSLIENRSTEFIGRTDWGLKEFKYPIKKRNSGYYVYYLFKSGTDTPVQLSHALKMNERILRHLIIAGNSRSIEYLDKLRSEPIEKAKHIEPAETTKEKILQEKEKAESQTESAETGSIEESDQMNMVEVPSESTSEIKDTEEALQETTEVHKSDEDEKNSLIEEEIKSEE